MADTNTNDPQGVTPPTTEIPLNETPEQKYQRLYTPQTQTQTVVATLPPEMTSTLEALRSELAEMKSRLNPPLQPVTRSEQPRGWVEKIREGKFDEAEASLAEATMTAMQPRIAAQIEAARQSAYNDALSASQVNVEVDRYMTQVRAANPDILPFERYLQGPVLERMTLAQQTGRVKTPTDFLREYKSAVEAEVGNLRNLGQQFRAAGKDEALTRTADVNRSLSLNPQQTQSTQSSQTSQQANPQGEDNNDYFARRRASEDRLHGRA